MQSGLYSSVKMKLNEIITVYMKSGTEPWWPLFAWHHQTNSHLLMAVEPLGSFSISKGCNQQSQTKMPVGEKNKFDRSTTNQSKGRCDTAQSDRKV